MSQCSSKRRAHHAICLAVLLWSTSATCLLVLQSWPIFFMTAILLSSHFLLIAMRLTYMKKWSHISSNLMLWCAGVLGVVGNDFCYYFALRRMSPVLVELISWCWPFFVMLYVHKLACSIRMCLGLCAAFFAIAILQWHDLMVAWHTHQGGHCGWMWALGSACTWAFYTVVSRQYPEAPQEMVGLYAGVGAVLAWGLHCHLEAGLSLHWPGTVSLCWMLLGPSSLAYYAWDYGVSYGAIDHASLYAFAIPVLSYFCLVSFGGVTFSWLGVISVLLLFGALWLNRDALFVA